MGASSRPDARGARALRRRRRQFRLDAAAQQRVGQFSGVPRGDAARARRAGLAAVRGAWEAPALGANVAGVFARAPASPMHVDARARLTASPSAGLSPISMALRAAPGRAKRAPPPAWAPGTRHASGATGAGARRRRPRAAAAALWRRAPRQGAEAAAEPAVGGPRRARPRRREPLAQRRAQERRRRRRPDAPPSRSTHTRSSQPRPPHRRGIRLLQIRLALRFSPFGHALSAERTQKCVCDGCDSTYRCNN